MPWRHSGLLSWQRQAVRRLTIPNCPDLVVRALASCRSRSPLSPAESVLGHFTDVPLCLGQEEECLLRVGVAAGLRGGQILEATVSATAASHTLFSSASAVTQKPVLPHHGLGCLCGDSLLCREWRLLGVSCLAVHLVSAPFQLLEQLSCLRTLRVGKKASLAGAVDLSWALSWVLASTRAPCAASDALAWHLQRADASNPSSWQLAVWGVSRLGV